VKSKEREEVIFLGILSAYVSIAQKYANFLFQHDNKLKEIEIREGRSEQRKLKQRWYIVTN